VYHTPFLYTYSIDLCNLYDVYKACTETVFFFLSFITCACVSLSGGKETHVVEDSCLYYTLYIPDTM